MENYRKNNLIMIGFMGAGKTSVGTAYAKQHGMKLLDTDQLIETNAGMKVSEIFAQKGEQVFRDLEFETIQKLAALTHRTVISTGGGLVMQERNRPCLRSLGTVVLLRVKGETVRKRLQGDTTRPLLAGENAAEKVRSLLELREPVYEEVAHLIVDVDGKSIQEIVNEIDRQLEKEAHSELK